MSEIHNAGVTALQRRDGRSAELMMPSAHPNRGSVEERKQDEGK